MKVRNPATDEVITDVIADTAASIHEKAELARTAQPAWARRALAERIAIIRKFRAIVVERSDGLAKTLTSETGKPITQARHEINGLLPRIDFFVDNVALATADELVLNDPDGGMREVITYEPLGVIANISAWNYPYFVGSNVFVPALLTGNAVLYKPSEFATLTGQTIGEMLWDAGVPPDAFAVVVGGGEVGAELLAQRIDGLCFTGSYVTGKHIAETVSAQLVRVQLELGGKDPVYVCDDVDVATAAESLADGAFYNNGQSCCSVERVYVHERVHDDFVSCFANAVRGFVIGDPSQESTYIGPLTRAAQLDTLEAQVADAVEKGAELVTGGRRIENGSGAWFEPTVLIGVNHEMTVMRDESFGPIIGIQKVTDDAEAARLMNDTEYGLTAGVYALDEARARSILQGVDAGSVYWNCCDRVSPRLPWSGRRHSGIGSTLSVIGLRTFVQPKAWHFRQP